MGFMLKEKTPDRRAQGMLGLEGVKMYQMNTGPFVLFGVEDGKQHLSISCKKRYPTWDELKWVRYQLMKRDARVAMILPPKEEYVNVHENCFHLWEL